MRLLEVHDKRLQLGGVNPVLMSLQEQARTHMNAGNADFERRDQPCDFREPSQASPLSGEVVHKVVLGVAP